MIHLFKRKPAAPLFDVTVLQPGQTVVLVCAERIPEELAEQLLDSAERWAKETGAKFVILGGGDVRAFALPMSGAGQ